MTEIPPISLNTIFIITPMYSSTSLSVAQLYSHTHTQTLATVKFTHTRTSLIMYIYVSIEPEGKYVTAFISKFKKFHHKTIYADIH